MEYLIKNLKNNGAPLISAEQLFRNFKVAVINNSPNGQVPQYGPTGQMKVGILFFCAGCNKYRLLIDYRKKKNQLNFYNHIKSVALRLFIQSLYLYQHEDFIHNRFSVCFSVCNGM